MYLKFSRKTEQDKKILISIAKNDKDFSIPQDHKDFIGMIKVEGSSISVINDGNKDKGLFIEIKK